MSELRRDPVMGRWVIIAPERALRTDAIITERPQRHPGPCVFCGGQETLDAHCRSRVGRRLRQPPIALRALRSQIELIGAHPHFDAPHRRRIK